jgi:hypothetical protein
MARRDAFGKLRFIDGSIEKDVDDRNQRIIPDVIQNPIQPLDLIPSARPRKKRERKWEREHQAEKATFRGIPPEIVQTIGDLATSLDVPRDEVVRAFLEHSLALHEHAKLQLSAHPKAQRMTLFPENDGKKNYLDYQLPGLQAQWLAEVFPSNSRKRHTSKPKNNRKEERTTQTWEYRLTCRLPPSLRVELKKIADDHFIPVGELVLFFLDIAMKDYQDGNFSLNPQPKFSGNTIF